MTYVSDIRPPIILAVIQSAPEVFRTQLTETLRGEPDVFEIRHNPVDAAMKVVEERRKEGYRGQFPEYPSEINLSDALIVLREGAQRYSEYAFVTDDPVVSYGDVSLFQASDKDLRRMLTDLLHCQDFYAAVSLFGCVNSEAQSSKLWFTNDIPSLACAQKLGDEVLVISDDQSDLDNLPQGVYSYLLTEERMSNLDGVLSDVADLLTKVAHGR